MKKTLCLIMMIALAMFAVGCGEGAGTLMKLSTGDPGISTGGEDVPIGGSDYSGGEDENPTGDVDEPQVDTATTDDSSGDATVDTETGDAAEEPVVKDIAIIISNKLPKGLLGKKYDESMKLIITGGDGAYQTSVTGLPEGLSFDATKKRVSGTPSEIGDFPLDVTVSDGSGKTATKKSNIKIVEDFALNVMREKDGEWVALDGELAYGEQVKAVVEGSLASYKFEVEVDGTLVETSGSEKEVVFTPTYPEGDDEEVTIKVTAKDDMGTEEVFDEKVTLGGNPCGKDIKITWDGCTGEDCGNGGGTFSIEGGMEPYIYDVEYFTGGKKGTNEWKTADESSGISVTDGEEGIDVKVDSTPVGGSLKIALSTTDSCEGRTAVRKEVTLIESKEVTVDKLRIVCDFADIADTSGNSFFAITLQSDKGDVTEVKYMLDDCSGGNVDLCEDERKFTMVLGGGALSSYEIWDLTGIKVTASKDVEKPCDNDSKVDVDLQWCKLYTKDYVAVYDDQIDGDKYNNDEAGGDCGCSSECGNSSNSMTVTSDLASKWMPLSDLPKEYKVPQDQ